MAIVYNGGVINSGNTPQAITGLIADRPAATDVAEGTIYISTDTQEIFSAQAGSWISVSGGGGGSQNIDQVLAVGNTATSKTLNFISTNFAGQYNQTRTYLNYTSGFYIHEVITQVNQNFSKLFRETILLTQNNTSTFNTESNSSGKNNILLKQFVTNNVNNFRSFEVNASYSDGNAIILTDSDTTTNQLCRFEVYADVLLPQLQISLTNISDTITNVFEKIDITPNRFYFIGFNSSTQELNVNLPASGSTVNNLPDYSGTIANVNERIVDNNVNLNVGNYDCATYGVYVITTGDNTNTFDLDNFVNGGTDGQFVTICVQDTPVKCANNIGNIYGTANINSNGLYKLMKIGNDIYSSHI